MVYVRMYVWGEREEGRREYLLLSKIKLRIFMLHFFMIRSGWGCSSLSAKSGDWFVSFLGSGKGGTANGGR